MTKKDGETRELGERGCELTLISVDKVGVTSELGERRCELTLISVDRVGAASELGEREFELELFSVGREIALEFERCKGGVLCSFEVTKHGRQGGSSKSLAVGVHTPPCLYGEGFDMVRSSVT